MKCKQGNETPLQNDVRAKGDQKEIKTIGEYSCLRRMLCFWVSGFKDNFEKILLDVVIFREDGEVNFFLDIEYDRHNDVRDLVIQDCPYREYS